LEEKGVVAGIKMLADFHDVEKRCEMCNVRMVLRNTRDIERKRFCSRSCLGTFNNLYGDFNSCGVQPSPEALWKMRESKMKLLAKGWRPTGWLAHPSRAKDRVSSRGYAYSGGKRVHRTVIGEHNIGVDEVVHHMDLNKLNNNIGNLCIMSRAEHLKLHAHIRMAGG